MTTRTGPQALVAPHTCHTGAGLGLLMWLFGMIVRGPADLPGEVAKRYRDGLVAVSRGVLVDERGPGAGVAEPGHQLFEAGAGGGGEGPARMPEIVEVHAGRTSFRAGLDPDPAEVGAPEPRTLGADEDQAPLPRLGEPLQVPADLGHEFGRERNRAAARA